MRVDALVLAGGEREPGLPPDIPNKTFLPIAGKPVVQRVVEAVRASPEIRRLVLVAPTPVPGEVAATCDQVLAHRGGLLENVEAGLAVLADSQWVLACAADLPLLTPKAVSRFLARCAQRTADLYYGIVKREDVESRFPGVRKTFVRVREGSFTGSSLVLLRPAVLRQVRPLLEKAVEARKNPAQLAMLVGGRYVVKYLSGRLSIADVEERVRELTGVRGAAVVCEDPEVALDVDVGSADRWAWAERSLTAE